MEDQGHEALYRCPSIPQTCPCLLIFQGDLLEKHIFCNVDKNRYHSKTIPEMRRKILLASFYEWLLLADRCKDDCHLFNPVLKEKLQLPPLKLEYRLERSIAVDYRKARFILSKPPKDPGCHVLIICDSGLILFCKLGDEEFVVQSTRFGDDHLTTAVGFKDKIYGLLRPSYKIVTIELLGSGIQVNPLINHETPFVVPQHSPISTEHFEEYLIESCGEVLCVRKIYSLFFPREVSHFQIFQLDLCNVVCKELDSLGERTIFLSNGMSYYIQAQSRIVGNSIYYTRPCDKNLYVYDVEYRSHTSLLPCPNLAISDWLGQCWVMMC